MKRVLTILAFYICISIAFAADKLSEDNWSFEHDSLPEMLPKKLRGKSDDEIQKAVFQGYQILHKLITEYNGRGLDSDIYGFFKDEMPISNTRTSDLQSELIFYNNAIKGFNGYNKNSITIKLVPNQVVTDIEWKELNVRGRYSFLNSTYFNQGKYIIRLNDVNYLGITPLAGNIEEYPMSIPKSSISYKYVNASFTGGLPDVLKTSDSPNFKHFLEDIVFQQVADRIVKDTHNNITVAIHHATKPYIIFKNDTYQNFPGTAGKFIGGTVGYNISNTVISGFGNLRLWVIKVNAKMATNVVNVDMGIVFHNLNGKFDVNIEDTKPVVDKATFTIGRIDGILYFNMLNPTECKFETTVLDIKVKYETKLSADVQKMLTNAFADNINNQLRGVCKITKDVVKPVQ